jgi:hypothetical protein
MGASRDGSMGSVEVGITDIRETNLGPDESGTPQSEGYLGEQDEKFWTVILNRFAALPTDKAARREEVLAKARDLGIENRSCGRLRAASGLW